MDMQTAAEPQKRKSIQSVESGVRLLEVLAGAPGSLQLRDVALASEMSRSQTHRYLLSYVHTGLVRQDPHTGRYELGPLALRIGLAALRRSEPVAIASEALSNVVEETGFTGLLHIWGEHGPTIVRLKQGRRHIVMSTQVGSVIPALGSSAGRVFLTYLPRATAVEAARREWRLAHPDDPDGWEAQFAKFEHEIREKGLATATDSTIPGLSAASAPVLDSQGEISAVLSLVTQASQPKIIDDITLAALEAASRAASARLGYGPDFDDDIHPGQ